MVKECNALVEEVAGYNLDFYKNDDPLYGLLIEWAQKQTQK